MVYYLSNRNASTSHRFLVKRMVLFHCDIDLKSPLRDLKLDRLSRRGYGADSCDEERKMGSGENYDLLNVFRCSKPFHILLDFLKVSKPYSLNETNEKADTCEMKEKWRKKRQNLIK